MSYNSQCMMRIKVLSRSVAIAFSATRIMYFWLIRLLSITANVESPYDDEGMIEQCRLCLDAKITATP